MAASDEGDPESDDGCGLADEEAVQAGTCQQAPQRRPDTRGTHRPAGAAGGVEDLDQGTQPGRVAQPHFGQVQLQVAHSAVDQVRRQHDQLVTGLEVEVTADLHQCRLPPLSGQPDRQQAGLHAPVFPGPGAQNLSPGGGPVRGRVPAGARRVGRRPGQQVGDAGDPQDAVEESRHAAQIQPMPASWHARHAWTITASPVLSTNRSRLTSTVGQRVTSADGVSPGGAGPIRRDRGGRLVAGWRRRDIGVGWSEALRQVSVPQGAADRQGVGLSW